ncbi:MAG: putative membrane protein [Promethearchaeota archaeon]|nr:MAG: putative membrane protein [Candidatus Lokiarchaeota archaeon]
MLYFYSYFLYLSTTLNIYSLFSISCIFIPICYNFIPISCIHLLLLIFIPYFLFLVFFSYTGYQ